MNTPKKKALEFVRKYSLFQRKLTAELMKDILQRQGFKLYQHNKNGTSSETVEALLHCLKLSEYAKGKDGFTYISGTDRLIFFHRQLSEDELLYVLLHEAGHIFCNHSVRNNILAYSDVLSESEANAFVFYVMKYTKSVCRRIFSASLVPASLLAIILFVSLFNPHIVTPSASAPKLNDNIAFTLQSTAPSEKSVYVTRTGKCYHNSWCHYVEGKTNLSELTCEQCTSLGLSPCSFCKPD